jgi:hypothetical protein
VITFPVRAPISVAVRIRLGPRVNARHDAGGRVVKKRGACGAYHFHLRNRSH